MWVGGGLWLLVGWGLEREGKLGKREKRENGREEREERREDNGLMCYVDIVSVLNYHFNIVWPL